MHFPQTLAHAVMKSLKCLITRRCSAEWLNQFGGRFRAGRQETLAHPSLNGGSSGVRSCRRGTFSYMPTSTGNYGIIEICWYERVERWVMHSLFTRQPRRPLHGDQSIMRIPHLNRKCRLHLPLIGTHRKLAS